MPMSLKGDIMFKSSKTMLAVGCSWTDPDYGLKYGIHVDSGNKRVSASDRIMEPLNFPRWPKIVGDKLGYKTVNLGLSGAGNSRIRDIAFDYLINNKVDLICVLWSGEDRVNFYNYKNLTPIHDWIHDTDTHELPILNKKNFYRIMMENGYRFVPDSFFRCMYTMQTYADLHDIPIYFGVGPGIWDSWKFFNWFGRDKNSAMKAMSKYLDSYIRSKYFEHFEYNNSNNAIGWPFYKILGGYRMADLLADDDGNNIHRISDIDHHPNQIGHEIIADEFLKIIKV